jgi:hypothetical protein
MEPFVSEKGSAAGGRREKNIENNGIHDAWPGKSPPHIVSYRFPHYCKISQSFVKRSLATYLPIGIGTLCSVCAGISVRNYSDAMAGSNSYSCQKRQVRSECHIWLLAWAEVKDIKHQLPTHLGTQAATTCGELQLARFHPGGISPSIGCA